MLNMIIATLLVGIASFTIISGLVAGYYLFVALYVADKEKTDAVIEGVNPVLGKFLQIWIGTRRTIDGILKLDFGIWLLTMLVVSVAIIVVLVWDSLFKSWTLPLLLLGTAIQVVVGLCVLTKMGIKWARDLVYQPIKLLRTFKSVCRFHRKLDREETARVIDPIMEQLRKKSGCSCRSMLLCAALDIANGKVTFDDACSSLRKEQDRINKVCEDNLNDDQKSLLRSMVS